MFGTDEDPRFVSIVPSDKCDTCPRSNQSILPCKMCDAAAACVNTPANRWSRFFIMKGWRRRSGAQVVAPFRVAFKLSNLEVKMDSHQVNFDPPHTHTCVQRRRVVDE